MSKYQQVLSLLDTFKTVSEVNDALGWSKATTQHYCKRLENLGYVEKVRKNVHGHPFMFKRLVETLSAEHVENLHNRKCLHRTQISQNKEDVSAIYNNYLFGNVTIEDKPKARSISFGGDRKESSVNEETKELIKKLKETYSAKRKSPRVYVGCSFNQVGW